jgi:hypothetical protein
VLGAHAGRESGTMISRGTAPHRLLLATLLRGDGRSAPVAV